MTSTRKYPVKGNINKDWISELESLIDQRDQHNEKRGHFMNTRLPSIDKENSENWMKETEEESLFPKWWKIIMDSIFKEKRRSENVLSTLPEKDIKL